ncbi:hypothetical protein HERIO_1828 [Hepatospora eriocheir]|uniref:Uncharacterized protein n=1 Tax=Hepatospora eriocheir TaxID=1081669 RepID=A0A1X0Q904_9MICR|nr:hypothetical protein HERIO_1828 [Hepatospora eriocheir]
MEKEISKIRKKKLVKLEKNINRKSGIDFKESDVVLRRNFLRDKLDKKWIGPYLIVRQFNNGTYLIKSIEDGQETMIHRNDQVKLENSEEETGSKFEWNLTREGGVLPKGMLQFKINNGKTFN